MSWFRFICALCASVWVLAASAGAADTSGSGRLKIYVDADFTITRAAAESIVQGLRAALAGRDHQVAGYAIDLVEMDHRGTPKRSQHNIARFLEDPDAIAVIGGMQSPPYLLHREFINEARIPLLLAWAAAAPLTRGATGAENYIFRLSVDDSKAGPFLLRRALDMGCERLAILLADTAWGRANRGTIQVALMLADIEPVITRMVSTEIGPISANNLVKEIASHTPDCTIAVLTAQTGAHVVNAFHEMGLETQFLSHWGILGSAFLGSVSHETREFVGLTVLQTCALEAPSGRNSVLSEALDAAGLTGSALGSIPAPAGFAHGYDLGLILSAAIERAVRSPGWVPDPVARRTALRDALEARESAIDGILKTYAPPFSPVTVEQPDGHEALSGVDLCFAKFAPDGTMVAYGDG